jgi:hypothetical protein
MLQIKEYEFIDLSGEELSIEVVDTETGEVFSGIIEKE